MNQLKRAIYPGTFDPITYGHLDILRRATAMFDEVIVALSQDSTRKTIFSLKERLTLLRNVLRELKASSQAPSNFKFQCPVVVESFNGLLVRFAEEKKAFTLVRGVRAISDFEYEFQMALMNRNQSDRIETVFLMPDEKYVYLSSTIVREIARLNGDLSDFVPPSVLKALNKKFGNI